MCVQAIQYAGQLVLVMGEHALHAIAKAWCKYFLGIGRADRRDDIGINQC